MYDYYCGTWNPTAQPTGSMNLIDVRKRLPEVGKEVLCIRTNGGMGGYSYLKPVVGTFNGHRFSCDFDWTSTAYWSEDTTFSEELIPLAGETLLKKFALKRETMYNIKNNNIPTWANHVLLKDFYL